MVATDRPGKRSGRGAVSNPAGRFASTAKSAEDDGWGILEEEQPRLPTVVRAETARSIIARNASPDIPFRQSINPYRGCEHGCIYCYARPSHAYVDLSPGLDFESQLFFKRDAAMLLRRTLAATTYVCSPIALGSNTDPYQPIERTHRVTRDILEVLSACSHPVTIVTKGAALIARDIDLLEDMARRRLVSVYVSVTTLDVDLKRTLEPRAASPQARLRVIEHLAQAGIPVGIMVAPVIPALTDHEIENILQAAAAAGARSAGYVVLRLPHEVAPLFDEWLDTHVPLRAEHVRSRLRALRGGRSNDPRFGTRMRGEGVDAELLARRLEVAKRRFGLTATADFELDTSRFVPPRAASAQFELF
jgi:DNA repair photolyase